MKIHIQEKKVKKQAQINEPVQTVDKVLGFLPRIFLY